MNSIRNDSTLVARYGDTQVNRTGVTAAASTQDSAALLGRVLLAAIFVISGFSKLTAFSGTVASIADHGLPIPVVLAAIAVLIELGAGLAIVFGWKTRWAALAFVVFLIVITPIFHNFWAADAAAKAGQQINFMKNMTILGGMILLFAFGPGRYSIDRG